MIRILPTKIQGEIVAPPSKAEAQRLLFMSAMSPFPSHIINVPPCEDIDVTLQCLMEFGCKISVQADDSVFIDPFPKNIPMAKVDLDFKESATCCKLALALASTLGIQVNATGSTRLEKRKLFSLLSRMAIRGVSFDRFSVPFQMTGRLDCGEYTLEDQECEQNVSALLMALPLLRDNSTVNIIGTVWDQATIDMTINCLEQFGIIIEKTKDGYKVPGKQLYRTPGEITVNNDWSLACMWLLAGAASGHECSGVNVTGLTNHSTRGLSELQNLMSVLCHDFQFLTVDASNIPNLSTIVAAMCIVKGAGCSIKGVSQLKFKESNRLNTLVKIAKAMGQDAKVTEDGIEIIGCEHPNYSEDIVIDCDGDPWIFMSMVLASVVATVPYKLNDESDAEKVYRNFLKDFKELGGKYEIVE